MRNNNRNRGGKPSRQGASGQSGNFIRKSGPAKKRFSDKGKFEGERGHSGGQRDKKRFDSTDKKDRSGFNSEGQRDKKRFDSTDKRNRSSFNSDGQRDKKRFDSTDKRNRSNFNSDGQRDKKQFDSTDKRNRSSFNSDGQRDKKRSDSFDRRGKSGFNKSGARRSKYEREEGHSGEERDKKRYDSFEKKGRSEYSDSGERRSGSGKFGKPLKSKDKSKKFEDYGDNFRKSKSEEFKSGKGDLHKSKRFGNKREGSRKSKRASDSTNSDGLVRLNKYLANAGIASRRDADTLIQSGVVKVNGQVVDQLGYKVKPGDVVSYADSVIKNERKVYLLLNKPKDFITTTDDPHARRTVMSLVEKACRERIYPVGRLDRNTTGILLFTNDGDLAAKLMHPKFNIPKVYHVTLNKSIKPDDFAAITEGIELEDGPVKIDEMAFVGEGRKEIGLEIHSGRNRIVRRIFEHLGYEVLKLDRVVYAGLTKKDLPRGKYRFLTEKEVSFLKMLS